MELFVARELESGFFSWQWTFKFLGSGSVACIVVIGLKLVFFLSGKSSFSMFFIALALIGRKSAV